MADVSANETIPYPGLTGELTHPSDKDFIQTINDEVEKRISALKDDCAREKSKQQQVFISAMVKLPRNVKNMSLSEFAAIYKVNLLKSIKTSQETPAASLPASTSARNLQTPFPMTAKSNMTPASRTVRKGELLL